MFSGAGDGHARSAINAIGWSTVIALVVLALPATWMLTELRLENEIGSWLSADDPQVQVLRWAREHFPAPDHILVSWEGSSLDDPRMAALAERLAGPQDSQGTGEGGLAEVAEVITPQQLMQRMVAARVDREEAIERLEGVLVGSAANPGQPENAGPPTALLVSLSKLGKANREHSLNRIRAAAEAVGIASDRLHLGGQVVTTAALNREVLKAVWNPAATIHKRSIFLLAALVGVVLAGWMLRSIRLGFLTLFVGYATAIVSVALLPLTGTSMNMVLVVMPTLLLVLTLSAGIHVVNYWKHTNSANPRTKTQETISAAWIPCVLASLTTAVGLTSLCISSLRPIRDFGFYSAVGMGVSLMAVLFGLPALLQLGTATQKEQKRVHTHTRWAALGRLVCRYNAATVSVCLAAFFVSAIGFKWFQTETKVARYFPEHSQLVHDYQFLERNIGGLVSMDIIVQLNPEFQEQNTFLARLELIRELGQRIRQHSQVSGTLSLADFRPVSAAPSPEARVLSWAKYYRRSNLTEQRLKRDHRSDVSRFLVVAGSPPSQAAPTEQESQEPGEELWRINAQTYVMSDADYGQLLDELNGIAASVLQGHDGAGHVITGNVPLFLQTQQAVLNSLIRSLGLAFCVIGLTMTGLLRSPLAGLIVMLPNVLPIGLVFGLLAWCGHVIDIGTMITGAVALGIAVDGTLHLLTWFRRAASEGQSRQAAVIYALQHCGPAMWQTNAVVCLSLLTLFPADLLLISRFGWVMAALIATALAANVVFLPALLAGPLGQCIPQPTAAKPSLQRRRIRLIPARRTSRKAG